MPPEIPQPIALLGGTGRSGPGLAVRFAAAGLHVLIGSRSADRAEEAAAVVRAGSGGKAGSGTNAEVARHCGIAVITVPHNGIRDLLTGDVAEALAGKPVVSTVVPVAFEQAGPSYAPPREGSAAAEIAALLPRSIVSAAFHSVSSAELRHLDRPLDMHVAVCCDDETVRAQTIALAGSIRGVRGVDAGGLRNAVHCEHLTVLQLAVNRAYRAHTGVRFTGLPDR